MNKKCSRCQIYKPFKEFNKCKNGSLGIHNHCRSCQKETRRAYYLNNKEKEFQYTRRYYQTEKARIARKKKYEANKEEILKKNRILRRTPEARRKACIARNKLFKNNMSFRLSVNLRTRIRQALMGIDKAKSTKELLGCTLEKFRQHLESLFQVGMTWNNYGYRGWHVDHITPCSSFDLRDPIQQFKCFHYTNLQPLWRFDNQSKGDKEISSL
jgi:hypothetical protein